jgi:hypothetical protein
MIKHAHFLFIFFLLICYNPLIAQETPSSGYKCVGGVYYTYEDYVKGNITDLGILLTSISDRIADPTPREIAFSKPDPTMTIGPQEYRFKIKENKIWGFRKTDGSTYRIDLNTHEIYNLVIAGPLYLWAKSSYIGRDEQGNVNMIHITYQLDFLKEGFSKHFYISKGGNGELISCNTKNLTVFFNDEPEILSKVTSYRIKDKDEQTLKSSMENVMEWVNSYNNLHK